MAIKRFLKIFLCMLILSTQRNSSLTYVRHMTLGYILVIVTQGNSDKVKVEIYFRNRKDLDDNIGHKGCI